MEQYTCNSGNCDCGANCSSEDEMESRLMMAVYMAQKKVLFEKIKQKIEEREGKKLDKVADLIVEAAMARWKDRGDLEKKHEEAMDRVREEMEK